MDYRKTAQEIYDHIGKKENIISAKGKVIDLVLPVIFLIVTVELCSTLNKIRRSSRTGLENLSRTLARDGGT